MRLRRSHMVALVVAIAVVTAAGGSAVGAASSAATADTPSEPAFVVDLQPDGDATVTLVVTYDLASDSDQQAFEQLRDDPSEITDRFEQRLSRIAAQTNATTDREMSTGSPGVDVQTKNGVGVISVSVEWQNLAAVSGDRLTLSEPFASEFQPDRQFVVSLPEGYQLTETSHEPAQQGDGTVQWPSGTNLSEFSTTFTTDGGASDSLPTPLSTLLALGLMTTLGYAGHHRLRRQ